MVISHGRFSNLYGRRGWGSEVEWRVCWNGNSAAVDRRVEPGAGVQQVLLQLLLLLLAIMRRRKYVIHVVPRLVHHCRHVNRLTAVCCVVHLDNPPDYLSKQTKPIQYVKYYYLRRRLSLYHNCDSTMTKIWHVHFLFASNRVEWKQARARRRSRIVLESQL